MGKQKSRDMKRANTFSMEKTGKGSETTDELIWGPAALAARHKEVRRQQAQFAQKRLLCLCKSWGTF